MSGWIGVDLDGTLAHYEGWNGGAIGAPIPAMVERIKGWLAKGIEVRIFTARAAAPTSTGRDVAGAVFAIEDWCERHIGQRLKVTAEKDFEMIELWDDRAIQVITNTGIPLIRQA